MKRTFLITIALSVCMVCAALTGSIKNMRTDYDVVLNNKKSIKVHIDYDLKGIPGETYYITLWFKDSDGKFKYISGDAKSKDKGIGYYVQRWSYSNPGTYSTWFAPALERLSLKPGESKFEVIAVIHDGNMNPLGSKTISINLPSAPYYPQTAAVISTPAEKADYKIALTPTNMTNITASQTTTPKTTTPQTRSNSVGGKKVSEKGLYAVINSTFGDEVNMTDLIEEDDDFIKARNLKVFVFRSKMDEFGVVIGRNFDSVDYQKAMDDYRKIINMQSNMVSVIFKKGSAVTIQKKTVAGYDYEQYYLSATPNSQSGILLSFVPNKKFLSLFTWTSSNNGDFVFDQKHVYSLNNKYVDIRRILNLAIKNGVFKTY